MVERTRQHGPLPRPITPSLPFSPTFSPPSPLAGLGGIWGRGNTPSRPRSKVVPPHVRHWLFTREMTGLDSTTGRSPPALTFSQRVPRHVPLHPSWSVLPGLGRRLHPATYPDTVPWSQRAEKSLSAWLLGRLFRTVPGWAEGTGPLLGGCGPWSRPDLGGRAGG